MLVRGQGQKLPEDLKGPAWGRERERLGVSRRELAEDMNRTDPLGVGFWEGYFKAIETGEYQPSLLVLAPMWKLLRAYANQRLEEG